ncbi:MAG TPA: maleylpyruvate isomerase N-terminal domain-containing protein [Vicinamibacteria bacterium]|nr:maleylpyruvate isomerase N-terminal domain-containing protein [Vicinamibacteria bacterium]
MATDRVLLKGLTAEWAALEDRLARDLPSWRPAAGPPLPVSPVALFAQLEEVLDAFGSIKEAASRHAGRYVTSAWTLKDLLGHLASWATEFRHEVQTVAGGAGFDYAIPFALNVIGPNEWNARAAERQRPVPLPDILEQFERETRRLQELVLELPPPALYGEAEFPLAPSGDPRQRFRGSIAMIVLGKCVHDLYHLGNIRDFLRRLER